MKLGARPLAKCFVNQIYFTKLFLVVFAWGFSLGGGGNIEIGMSSKFELDKFVVAPTEEQFEQCRKDDLVLIADFYNIELPRSALKREIKEILHTELVKQKVLPGTSVITGVATTASSDDLEAAEAEFKSEDIARMDPVSPSTKNPLLAIRLKELEVELCRQQYQNQLLHVRAVELETQRDIRLRAGAGTKDSTGSAFTFSRVTGKFSSADSSTGLFSSPCSVVRITGKF